MGWDLACSVDMVMVAWLWYGCKSSGNSYNLMQYFVCVCRCVFSGIWLQRRVGTVQVWWFPEGGSQAAHRCAWRTVLWLHTHLSTLMLPTTGTLTHLIHLSVIIQIYLIVYSKPDFLYFPAFSINCNILSPVYLQPKFSTQDSKNKSDSNGSFLFWGFYCDFFCVPEEFCLLLSLM